MSKGSTERGLLTRIYWHGSPPHRPVYKTAAQMGGCTSCKQRWRRAKRWPPPAPSSCSCITNSFKTGRKTLHHTSPLECHIDSLPPISQCAEPLETHHEPKSRASFRGKGPYTCILLPRGGPTYA